MFGFLNIDKPADMTSFDVIAKLRKIFNIKKIGHSGTLDPFATGVLPVAIGKATRLIDYLRDEKAYIADIQFGKETDTYDIKGNFIKEYDRKVKLSEIEEKIELFQGEIDQTPPMYSAIHYNGKRLYEFARKGEIFDDIPKRKVIINEIKILNFDENKQLLKLYIDCSKGTYIRSIAFDLGRELNCGGYLSALRRTKSSNFLIENSIPLKDVNKEIQLISPETVFDFPKIQLGDEQLKKILNGQFVNIEVQDFSDLILMYREKFVGIGFSCNNVVKGKRILYEKD